MKLLPSYRSLPSALSTRRIQLSSCSTGFPFGPAADGNGCCPWPPLYDKMLSLVQRSSLVPPSGTYWAKTIWPLVTRYCLEKVGPWLLNRTILLISQLVRRFPMVRRDYSMPSYAPLAGTTRRTFYLRNSITRWTSLISSVQLASCYQPVIAGSTASS